jgi:hypothetical protein
MNIQIAQLDRQLPSGLITALHWTASQTDGDFTASAYGSLGVPTKAPPNPWGRELHVLEQLVPLLTAALQEAVKRIESFEQRIQTLEGNNNNAI